MMMMTIIATIISMHVCNLYSIRKTFEKPDTNEGQTSKFHLKFDILLRFLLHFTLIHSRSFSFFMYAHCVHLYRCQVSCICVSAYLEESIQEMHDILDLILILYFCALAKHDVIFLSLFYIHSASSCNVRFYFQFFFLLLHFYSFFISQTRNLHFHLQQEGREKIQNQRRNKKSKLIET